MKFVQVARLLLNMRNNETCRTDNKTFFFMKSTRKDGTLKLNSFPQQDLMKKKKMIKTTDP